MSLKQLQEKIIRFSENTSRNLKTFQAVSTIIQGYQKNQNQIQLYSEFENKLKQLYDTFEENQMILKTIYDKSQQIEQSDVETVENQQLIVEKGEKVNKKLPFWVAEAQQILVLQNFVKRKIQQESVKKWPVQFDVLLELSILYKYNVLGFKQMSKQEILCLFE